MLKLFIYLHIKMQLTNFTLVIKKQGYTITQMLKFC
jgi:hypothetical protein